MGSSKNGGVKFKDTHKKWGPSFGLVDTLKRFLQIFEFRYGNANSTVLKFVGGRQPKIREIEHLSLRLMSPTIFNFIMNSTNPCNLKKKKKKYI